MVVVVVVFCRSTTPSRDGVVWCGSVLHRLQLLLTAVLSPTAAIACPPGPRQQTRRTLL